MRNVSDECVRWLTSIHWFPAWATRVTTPDHAQGVLLLRFQGTSAPKEDPHSLGADVPAAHCGTWRGITDRNVPDKCERRAAYAAPETATAPTSARVLIGSCAFLFPTERKRNGGPKTFPRAGRLPLKS